MADAGVIGDAAGHGRPRRARRARMALLLAVLEQRARMKQELWHPLDATAERSAPALAQAG